MDISQFSGLDAFLNTDQDQFQGAFKDFVQICNNVIRGIRSRNEGKRRISLGSADFTENLLGVPGALEALFEMGFEEDPVSNDHLLFPITGSTDLVRRVRSAVQRQLIKRNLNDSKHNIELRSDLSGSYACASRTLGINSRNGQASIQNSLFSMSKQVRRHEDPELQQKIRTTIPLDFLEDSTRKMCEMDGDFKTDASGRPGDAFFKSVFLFVLLKWFKEDFFRWVNNLECQFCHSETDGIGITPEVEHLTRPSAEDLKFGASRIELFSCRTCRKVTRFPRYNDPLKLLETRKGRCGEWANFFTAICRAVGFDARHVHDNADHVWTEVYSELEKRWLHCDSCETALDKPLVYESGWGKKLSYVFAVSRDEIVDVSWRYCANHAELMKRRQSVDEKWLRKIILTANQTMQKKLTAERRSILQARRFRELVEFLSPRTATDADKVGRSSGDVWWRLSRGELGLNVVAKQHVIITPTESEIQNKKFRLSYNASTDLYVRGETNILGFAELAFSSKDITRKVESDWKMAYLARQPGSSEAVISWKLVCPAGSDLSVKTLKVQAPREVFDSGMVRVSVRMDDQLLTENAPDSYFVNVVGQSKKSVTIQARLSGGNGENAWQHSQLFREHLNGPFCPLVIEIDFE